MSERRYLICDSCGTALPLPTTPEAAATWSRLSKSTEAGLVFRHVCGGCDDTAVRERLAALW
jgi:hypothetical protein